MTDNLENNISQTVPEKKPRKKIGFLFIVFLLILSFYIGFNQGKKSSIEEEISAPLTKSALKNKFSEKENVDFSLFWKVWDLVKNNHVNKNTLDAQKMVYGAINGMLRATEDPYSSFMDPKETKDFSEQINGSFEGIGAELGIKESVLTVISPLEDSPAEKAGLRPGDKIIKIDGKISTDFDIDQAVDLIRGKKGTNVVLTIFRNGDNDTKDITVTRDVIKIKSVKLEFKENNVAHLKINEFGDQTTKEFRTAVNQILEKKSKGIILDLRNNPGGLLDKCVEIASFMMPKGEKVVTEEDSAGAKENLYTEGNDKISQIPMVILINEGSASASEILAGALKDNKGITLIGKKTFGKGTVQQLMSLPGKTSVKITVAKWLTPGGIYIAEKGISPDVEVEMKGEDYDNNRDPQLDKALEILKEKIETVK
jgi:carboxyl-terminal processing protease